MINNISLYRIQQISLLLHYYIQQSIILSILILDALEYPTCIVSDDIDDIKNNKDTINIDTSDMPIRRESMHSLSSFTSIETEHLELKRQVGMTSSAQMKYMFKLYKRFTNNLVKGGVNSVHGLTTLVGDGSDGDGNDNDKHHKSVKNTKGSRSSGRGADRGHKPHYASSLNKKHVKVVYPDQILPYDPCAEQNTIGQLYYP